MGSFARSKKFQKTEKKPCQAADFSIIPSANLTKPMEKPMTRNVQKTLGIRVALVAAVAFPLIIAMSAYAQEPAPTATPPVGTTGSNIAPTGGTAPAAAEATAERVVVTGSNIPTAEEVGPNPVDTYRRDDITRLGVRTPTDLVLRIPAATGSNTTENNTNGGDGSTRISLRGIDPKETLVLQDGRRLAYAGTASVDFNRFPLGLIDHIDILKDGASPIYGTEAVAGVVNVFLIHRFRGLEVYGSYGNTNLGFASERALFNFADLTPSIAASDREYLYGSFDRDICDKYLTVFADFEYFRQFWDGGLAPTPFVPDVWTDLGGHTSGLGGSGPQTFGP